MIKKQKCLVCEIPILIVNKLTIPICRNNTNCYIIFKLLQKGMSEFKCYCCKKDIDFSVNNKYIVSRGKRILPTLMTFFCGLECLDKIKNPLRFQLMKKMFFVINCIHCQKLYLAPTGTKKNCANLECQKLLEYENKKRSVYWDWHIKKNVLLIEE